MLKQSINIELQAHSDLFAEIISARKYYEMLPESINIKSTEHIDYIEVNEKKVFDLFALN